MRYLGWLLASAGFLLLCYRVYQLEKVTAALLKYCIADGRLKKAMYQAESEVLETWTVATVPTQAGKGLES